MASDRQRYIEMARHHQQPERRPEARHQIGDHGHQLGPAFRRKALPVRVCKADRGNHFINPAFHHLRAIADGGADDDDCTGNDQAKAENDVASLIKNIAEKRGRNVECAEKSVRDSDSITSSPIANGQSVMALAGGTAVSQLRYQLSNLADIIKIYLCDWLYLWPFFTKDCLTTVEVDSDGRFHTD